MTNNRQQPMSPEMLHIVERGPTLSLAIGKALNVLDENYNIRKFIADEEAVEITQDRPFVLKAIEYTIKTPVAEIAELPTNVSSFPSSEQHYMLIDAENNVDDAFKEMAA